MREDSFATYEKVDHGPHADLAGEAAGLRWLGAAEKDGGLSCARVVSATAHRLVEERIPQGAPTREKARRAGAALARTHAAGAAWYGCPPPGWDGPGYAIGRSLTPVVSASARDGALSWGAACAEWRVMPHVRTIRDDGLVDAAEARRAGAALARTHAAGAAWYGCPPPGWDGPGYAIGRSLTPVVSDSARDGALSWGAACAEWRVMSHVRTIRDDGLVDAAEVRLLTRVADRMAAGDFDSPEPALVRAGGHACARIHGDLWSGNLLWAQDGTRAAATGAALIDPMASGGHAETDLAMLQLFGCAYLDDLLAAYDEASPLADGWRDRVAIHQLVPVLLHCVLFGGDYVGLALSIARRYA